MSVVFSHDIFSLQRAGGISRCMLELMRSLSELRSDWVCWAGRHKNILLDEASRGGWAAGHYLSDNRPSFLGRFGGTVLNERPFADFVNGRGGTVVHRTYHPPLDLTANSTPVVETLHDMLEERWQGQQRWTRHPRIYIKRRALERADAIACVSRTTMEELGHVWPEFLHKALVIPHGVRRLSERPVKPNVSRPYFLYVGERLRYKNFSVVLDALRSSRLLADFDLLCFGGGPLKPHEIAHIQRTGLSGRVHQTGAGDHALAGAYEHATALVYPSDYEGFGMPLLEAMVHNCPVIAAASTSLPEVGGKFARYVTRPEAGEWAEAMEASAALDTDRAVLLRSAAVHASSFTWQAAAAAYDLLYRSLS